MEATHFYTAPSKSIYRSSKPERAHDVPVRRHAPIKSSDDTTRQRFLADRASANVRWWFNLATYAALIGVVFGIMESELLWAARNVASMTTEGLKWCILLTTMIGVAALFEYGTWNIKLRRAKGDFVPEGERYYLSLTRCGIYWEIAGFMATLCVLPLPSFNYEIGIWDMVKDEYVVYSVDSLCVGTMLLLRIVFLVKYVVINDPVHKPCNALYAKSCKVDLSTRFVLLTRMRESFQSVVVVWLLSISTLAYCITLAERPHDGGQQLNDFDSELGIYHNSLWLTTTILTTVGNSDHLPRTALGGMLAAAACGIAVVLVACTVNIVMYKVALDDTSKRVLALTLAARHNTALRRQAVRCIERLYLLSPIYRRLHSDALPRLKFGGRAAVKELQDAHTAGDKTVNELMACEYLFTCHMPARVSCALIIS